MIGRINCQAAITSFCKLNAHGSFTHQNIFFQDMTFIPNELMGWSDWNIMTWFVAFAWVCSRLIQCVFKNSTDESWQMCAKHMATSFPHLSGRLHFGISMTLNCLFTFLRLLCHMLFWARFMMFSIQTAATQKETIHGLSWDFFARPAPPPRDWLNGMTGRFWRPKQWKTHCYWEHISHINVSQPLPPYRIMMNYA